MLLLLLLCFSKDFSGHLPDTVKRLDDHLLSPGDDKSFGQWVLDIQSYSHLVSTETTADWKRVQYWVTAIRHELGDASSDKDVLKTIAYVLYQPNSWNGHVPFEYDLDDPQGNRLESRFLSTYLRVKKGNCYTMPLLVLILAKEVKPSIRLFLAQAPRHLFLMLNSPDGRILNFEATNGTPCRTEYLIESFHILPEGIAMGVYLRPLSERETFALIFADLAQTEIFGEDFQKAVQFLNVVKHLSPRSTREYVTAATLYLNIAFYHRELWRDDAVRSSEQQAYIQKNQRRGEVLLQKAKDLGWQEPIEKVNGAME